MATYRDHCASCHGPFGRGDGEMAARLPGRPTNFADGASVDRLSPDEAFRVITEGRLSSGMPPWRNALTAGERWDALFAAWSFHFTPDRLARSKALWEAKCASCHGPAAQDATAPGLAELSSWERIGSLSRRDWSGNVFSDGAHQAMLQLPESERRLALDYLRAQSFKPLAYEALEPVGAISGTVTNGTTGTSAWADLSAVRLRVVPFASEAMVPAETTTPTLSADGHFGLNGLFAGPGLKYHVVTTYKDIDYIYPATVQLLLTDTAPAQISVTVYEPSPDAKVNVDSLELIVAPEAGGGQVSAAEVWRLANRTTTSRIAPEGGAVVELPLPAGYSQLAFDDARTSQTARVEGGKVMLEDPLPPGEREVALTYALTSTGQSLTLERELPQGAGEVVIRLLGNGLKLEGPGLVAEPPSVVDRDGVELAVQTFRQGRVAPGGAFRVTLSGLPTPPMLATAWVDASLLAYFGAALAALGILFGLTYPLWKRPLLPAGGGES